jgi:pimeloyl-ACP methyl ester carboxylesterase
VIDAPAIRYVDCAGVKIAYQVFGEGGLEVVFVPGGISHLDLAWQDRRYQRMMQRLTAFARVTAFDKRGMGASDPMPRPPTLEERMEDIGAVMDAVGIEQAAVLGLSEGASSAALFAATFPQRTRALVLCGAFPGGAGITDPEPDFPAAVMREFWEKTVAPWKDRFGQGITLELFAPSLAGDERAVAAMATFERLATTPAMFRAMIDGVRDLDVRPILSSISAATLVIHRREDPTPIEGARYMASRIRGAKLVELEGDDHLPWLGDMDALVDEVQEFLTGAPPTRARAERRLATVLFTDIVDSTDHAAKMGDRRWRALLEDHHDAMRALVERFDGRLVKTIGDGTLALFDGPARAVECAREGVRDAARLGIELRAGVHAGECELMGDDVGGIAVHVGARIAALAGPDDVLVSSTVKELVAGSELTFADRGMHELKGVPAEWRVYSLV